MGIGLNPFTGLLDLTGGSSVTPGDVFGPASSTDNAIVRFDGTDGKHIQNSNATIDDSGNITATNLSGTNTGDVTVTDTDTVDLTLTGQALEADVRISDATITSDASGIKVGTIQDANVGTGIDATKIADGSVSNTEFQYINSLISNAQDQIDDKIDLTEKGANNGVATLDAGGKVPVAQLPNSIMEFQGVWDASTNTPTLADGVGNLGDVYRVNVAGTQDLGSGSQTFIVGDWAVYDSNSEWKLAHAGADAVLSVNSQAGIVVLDTDDIAEGATNFYYTETRFDDSLATKTTADLAENTNLYFTDERAQDAIGTILVDSSSIDLTYDDGTPSIIAAVIPGGVDHDQLLNFVANEHVDHSSVQIATAANTSGLTGGGDITATRNLSVDINGTTAETSADNADKLLIYDNSATSLKSMTRANFLSGIALSSPGDLSESSFSGANNQGAAANVTGFAFSNAVVRSFKALVSVHVDATSSLYETFELQGVQRGADWTLGYSSLGDDSLVAFTITSAGQIQYTSGNYSGFTALTIKFRSITTSV